MKQQTKYIILIAIGAFFMGLGFLISQISNDDALSFIIFLVGSIMIVSVIKNAIERHINYRKTGDPDSSWKDKYGNIRGF